MSNISVIENRDIFQRLLSFLSNRDITATACVSSFWRQSAVKRLKDRGFESPQDFIEFIAALHEDLQYFALYGQFSKSQLCWTQKLISIEDHDHDSVFPPYPSKNEGFYFFETHLGRMAFGLNLITADDVYQYHDKGV
ncbi:MAG: hypothetical protein KDH94_08675, partial [Coxiellaceae bacterium]|nr:hypothetical protein [Coxiellaceae bacterium]